MKHGQQWYICHFTISGMIGIECAKPTMLWGYHMMEYDYHHFLILDHVFWQTQVAIANHWLGI